MTRGVKAGTLRGKYKQFNKLRLRKMARDVRLGDLGRECVAQAFESSKTLPDLQIARALRSGENYDAVRLANAIESLGNRKMASKPTKPLPLWMVKAALKHQRGMTIHAALNVDYPYTEDPKLRAFHRRMNADYGNRSKGQVDQRLGDLWPDRKAGQFPEVERALTEALSGNRVPIEVYRAQARRDFPKCTKFRI